MGTNVAPAQPQAPVAPQPQVPAKPQSAVTTPEQPHVVHVAAAPTHTVVSAGSLAKTHSDGKKSPVSIPILILAGIVFFFVYALFWTKFFNFKLPFLP